MSLLFALSAWKDLKIQHPPLDLRCRYLKQELTHWELIKALLVPVVELPSELDVLWGSEELKTA